MCIRLALLSMSVVISSVAAGQEAAEEVPKDELQFAATLQTVKSTVILNTIPGRSTISTILPEGTRVRAGDVICTLEIFRQNELANELRIALAQAHASRAAAASEQDSQKRQLQYEQTVAEYEVSKAKRALEAWTRSEYPLSKVELEGTIQIGTAELEFARAFAADVTDSRLESLRAQVEVARAEAELRIAQLQLKNLQEFLHPQRTAELNTEMRLAQLQLEQGLENASAKSFEVEMAANQKRISMLEERLAETLKLIESGRIVAPHDGIVLHANQQVGLDGPVVLSNGTEVRERQVLMQLHDLSGMKVIFTLAPDQAERLIIGSNAEVRVDALPQQPFAGRLTEIGRKPVTRDGQVLAAVRLDDVQEAPLRPGMTAVVTIQSRD